MANKVNVSLDMNVQGYVQGMDQATDSTKKYETETKKIKDSVESFRKQFSKAKKDTLDLALAYSKLSKEAKASQFGQEMARQLQEATEKQAQLKDMLEDTNRTITNMASDTRGLNTLAEGMNVVANATSLYMGVLSQLTGEEKAAKQAVVMFTTAQSALNTMTALQTALQKESNIMLGINAIQNKAAAIAENMKAAATGRGTVATIAATAAQKAFNLVAKANPYVLLATAVIAVGTALFAFSKNLGKASEDEEKLQQETEKANKKIEEQRQTFMGAASSAYATAQRVSHLAAEYKNCKDEVKKTAIINEAAGEFKKLGIEVKGAADAQKILANQSGDVVKLIKLQGEAAGLAAVKMQYFKESMDMLMKNGYDASTAQILAGSNKAVVALDKQIDKINEETASLKKNLGIRENIYRNNKTTKVKIDYEVGSLADLQAQLSKLQDKLKKKNLSLVDKENTLKEIERLKGEIEKKEIELKIKEPDPKKVVGSAAWYTEQIKELEKKKALLPLDAYIERDKLQKQIDNFNLKVKLETEGIEIRGSADVSKALKGTYDKTIKGISDAISTLERKLQGDVGENGQLLNSEQIDIYTAKVIELKQELAKIQKVYDESLITPAEKAKEALEGVGSAISSLSDLFNSMGDAFDNKALNIAGIISQAVANYILGWTEATAKAAKLGPIGWLGFGLSTAAQMFAVVSQIKSAGKFAQGGTVGGSSYYGDKLMAFVNSGETILTRDQTKNVVNAIDNNKLDKQIIVIGETRLRGSDLYISYKNFEKSHNISTNKYSIYQ